LLHRFPPCLLWCGLCVTAARSIRTATKPVHIFGERDSDELERLGHRRVDVNQINEVVRGGSEAQGHRRLVNDFIHIHPKHGDAGDPPGWVAQNHFDHAPRIAGWRAREAPTVGHGTPADEPNHDAGCRASGSDVLAIPLLSVLLGARRCMVWRSTDLLFSVHNPSFSTEYPFFGLQQSNKSSGIVANPAHECGPTRGLPGKTEKEEPWSGVDSLLDRLTALVQYSWNAYQGKILTIARRPDYRTHLVLASIGKLNHVALCGGRAWFDLDLPIFQHLFQFQAQHRFRLCFEPGSKAGAPINLQESKVIQVPEEAFAQQREWDKVQRMCSSQRHRMRASQFRSNMRAGIACSH